jgi:competence protein ComEC
LTLLANVVAMPVVDLVVMPMAMFSVLAMPFGLESLPLAPMGWGIDWMMLVARFVAGWSAGWGGVPAFPLAALLLFVAGFLWLALWRERWRFMGIVPMILALPIAASAPKPDILINAGGTTVAVRNSDGRYSIVNPRADRFAAEYWLRADADSRPVDDDDLTDGVACDGNGCVARMFDGTRVAVGSTPAAFEDDCLLSGLVISRYRAPPSCAGAATVIDRAALGKAGAHALYVLPDAPAGSQRFRIETAYPPGPRRPFMPPVQ